MKSLAEVTHLHERLAKQRAVVEERDLEVKRAKYLAWAEVKKLRRLEAELRGIQQLELLPWHSPSG